MGVQKEKVSKRAWASLILVWITSIMAPVAQFKVTPISSFLMAEYGFDVSTFGLLMSSMSLIGIILAFPAAYITGKLGPKKSILISLCILVVGTVIGALAPTANVLLFSRVIEGFGLAFMGISAPLAITVWFPPSRRGFPLGLWSTWVPVGVVLALNVAPRIAQTFGVSAVWWADAALTFVVVLVFACFYKLPTEISEENITSNGSVHEVLRLTATPSIWILGITFFAFNVVGTTMINTYYPTYLQQTYSMQAVESSQITSYYTLFCIFTSPLGGILFEKTRRAKLLLCLGLFILGVSSIIGWIPIFELNLMFVLLASLGAGIIAGICRSFAVELLYGKNEIMATPVAQAILTFVQRACDFIAPIVFGAILGNGGSWQNTSIFMVSLIVISIVALIAFLKFKDGTPAPNK